MESAAQKTIELPPKFVGALIGTRGANINRIKAESGAQVWVKDNRCEIKGSDEAVANASAVVEKQLANYLNKVALNYEHPQVAVVLLSPAHEPFCRFAPTADLPDKFRLVFSVETSFPTEEQQTRNPADVFFRRSEVDRVIALFRDSISSSLATNKVKVRFSLGRQLFYRSMKARVPIDPIPTNQLSSFRIGHDQNLKAIFDNAVDPLAVDSVVASLDRLGCREVEQRRTLSVHLKDKSDDRGFRARYLFDGSVDAPKFEAVQAASRRLCFVGLPNSIDAYENSEGVRSSTLDARFKLLARDAASPEDEKVFGQTVAAWDDVSGTAKISWPRNCLHSSQFEVFGARRKDKRIFQGRVDGAVVRVSVAKVCDSKGSHYEINGSFPAWNANLGDKVLFATALQFCKDLHP